MQLVAIIGPLNFYWRDIMVLHFTEHRYAFALAAMLIPTAVWTAADGDVGQCEDGDIGLEDKASEATMVLHADGTASFSHYRLIYVTPHLTPKA